ncbi:MAG TPA: hypothetical protein VNT55_25350 [Baekduia sp.]|nr:hypothetical protein [Baekduia sp.]
MQVGPDGGSLAIAMHTATQLDRAMFAIDIDGHVGDREQLIPGWDVHDRLGVIVHEPFGALGASHLIQVAITAFYDARPSRRAAKPIDGDPDAIYPEIYLFHVGGRHGDHSWLDVWPARKEVFVANDARRVLDAVNDRAITRLAVPDAPPHPIEHEWKEPAAARDRIRSVFAYSATGRVVDADVSIRGLVRQTEFNVRQILDPDRVAGRNRFAAVSPALDADLRARSYQVQSITRAQEAASGLGEATARREVLRTEDLATETYRRIELDDALNMLALVE